MTFSLMAIKDLMSIDQCFSNWGDKNLGGLWIYFHGPQVLCKLYKTYIFYIYYIYVYIFHRDILKLGNMFIFQITFLSQWSSKRMFFRISKNFVPVKSVSF